MLFVDYAFDLIPNGTILFESDLKPEQLGVKDGDEFVVAIIDQKIAFIKKDK